MKIAIIGLGYVGLPLSIEFASVGLQVIGIDVDEVKVEALNRGESYIRHIDAGKIKSIREGDRFEATTDFSRVNEVDAVLICVPTPLNKHREPNIDYVLSTGRSIAPHLQKGVLVVLESTTYPGTTEDELLPILEEGSGLKGGEGIHIAYSPEREDPGNKNHHVSNITKVVGGLTEGCRQKAVALYSRIVEKIHPVSSCRVAEATKLSENIFRSVNIALANELKVVYSAMGIDIWEVIEAASTKPFGYMPFYPGPGLGGHCIPIDPFYLTWKAREYEQHTRFIELAGEINTAMPDYVISKVVEALNDESKPIRGSRILLLGLAYKPNVDDDRESPSYVLMEKLEKMGATVSYNDPFIPEIKLTRDYPHFAGRKSQEISDDYDLILISTHHEQFKTFDFSSFQIPLVDTRNCVSKPNKKYTHA